jgi:transcriptional regulator with XRE-family HTH domain
MLKLSQQELADAAGVSRPVIWQFEGEVRVPVAQHRAAIRRALEEAGALLIPPDDEGPGVKLKRGTV